MNKFKKILSFALILVATTLMADRVELGKLTISNDFTVTGNTTLGSNVTFGGTTVTNFVIVGTNAGDAYDSLQGQAASKLAASAYSNATNAQSNAANAQVTANLAMPAFGGTFTGGTVYGTNLITIGTNIITIGGRMYPGTSTNAVVIGRTTNLYYILLP